MSGVGIFNPGRLIRFCSPLLTPLLGGAGGGLAWGKGNLYLAGLTMMRTCSKIWVRTRAEPGNEKLNMLGFVPQPNLQRLSSKDPHPPTLPTPAPPRRGANPPPGWVGGREPKDTIAGGLPLPSFKFVG